jgi:hypothetical protein
LNNPAARADEDRQRKLHEQTRLARPEWAEPAKGGAVKRQRIGHSLALASVILIGDGLGVGGFGPAAAQEDAPGGTTLTFGIETGLSVSDNYSLEVNSPGSSTILDTTLSFGYLSQTANSRFAFDIDGVLRIADLPGTSTSSGTQFDDINAALRYDYEGANSRFTASADYNRIDLDFLDPFSLSTINDVDLTNSGGTRNSRNARILFETGINDPLGFGFELGHDNFSYTDTTDPGLFDTTTNDYALTSRLRLSPVAEARARLSQEDYTAGGLVPTDRTTRALSFGLAYELSPATTFDGSIGVEEIEEGGSTDRGGFGTLGLTQARVNGTASLLLDQSFGIEGSRTTLTAARDLALPSGTLAFSIGVTRGETSGTELVGSIDYSHTLPGGTLTASLDRSVDSSTSGNDILTTNAALGYTMALSPVADLSFDFDYAEIENDGTGLTSNTSRKSLRAEYTRALTEDWDLSAGYEHQRLSTQGTGSANSNTLFLTLGREFSIRR